MSIESVLMVILWIVVIFALAWLCHWIITTYFPEPVRTPALLLLGVVLLILVIFLMLRLLPGGGDTRLGFNERIENVHVAFFA